MFHMTIQDLINTLDEFRDEYNTSADPAIQKLCVFITNTINGLNSYVVFFQNSKSAIQTSQQHLEESVTTIDALLGETDSSLLPETADPSLGG